jgi:carboxyl-terminal processing protease
MKLKRAVIGPVLVASVAFVSGGWLMQREATGTSGVDARIFDEVLSRVTRDYVDPHDQDELYEMAVEGFLRELGDPHTSFMSAAEYGDLRVQTSGEYGGLGIQIAEKDGWVTVLATLPGTPAERAGLQTGDRIVEVAGESTKGWTDDDAVKVLRGPRGSPVTIKVERIGVDTPIPYTIVREEIRVKSVRYSYMVEPGIGLARLDVFSETSTDELRTAINSLRQAGMRGLILDLRSNPGGLLDQGVSVSNLFLSPGQAIVETRGRDTRDEEQFTATRPQMVPGLPIVVLVDDYSASAAEIVAGALQDHDRAVVVGLTTFGKGSVQSLFPLSGGNFLKMTTGRWFTPSGRSIQKPKEEQAVALGMTGSSTTSTTIGADGTPVPSTQAVDTTKRQEYRTDSGRTVYGGGGIVPDLIVKPDTLSNTEKEFFTAAAKSGSKFNDVVFRYALEYSRAHPNLARGFAVTPEMTTEFYNRLKAAGVEGTRAQFDAAARLIRQRLAYEISLAKFGPTAASERTNSTDDVVNAAVELLRGTSDQAALFRKLEVTKQASRS